LDRVRDEIEDACRFGWLGSVGDDSGRMLLPCHDLQRTRGDIDASRFGVPDDSKWECGDRRR
jgi:hypothetical protein